MAIEMEVKNVSSLVHPEEQLIHYRYRDLETFENQFASIDFLQISKGDWYISWVTSKAKGQGSRIVAEFVSYIGKNQKVGACIINNGTQQELLDLGYLDCVQGSNDTIEITEPRILDQIKIVRMLKKGGIITERLIVREAPQEDIDDGIYFHLLYCGRT